MTNYKATAMIRFPGLFFCLALCTIASLEADSSLLNEGSIDKWEYKIFKGETRYNFTQYKGRDALKAVSKHSASGYFLKKRIDLSKTPYINWSWLVEKKLPPLNERSKKGDDYVARVYVVIDGGLLVWKTLSLNYVWSGSQKEGQIWNNAFAGDNVKMIAVRGSDAKTGQWYDEKRNVYQDLIDNFGDKGSDKANRKAYRYIDVLAIMTDTDNSGGEAESYYGDIIFSEK